jgi:hypothetical protein
MKVAGRATAFLLTLLSTSACIDTATDASTVADVRGTWRYVGSQQAPAVQLNGTLIIEEQEGDLLSGRANWEERTAQGMVQSVAGAVSGRVIELTDVDFDVRIGTDTRRHVARISGDTLRGTWVLIGGGRTGEFTAVRGEE